MQSSLEVPHFSLYFHSRCEKITCIIALPAGKMQQLTVEKSNEKSTKKPEGLGDCATKGETEQKTKFCLRFVL
jgi:hypothetical protein